MQKNQAGCCGQFENRDLLLFIAFLTSSARQDSDAKKNSDDFYFGKSCSRKSWSTETLMKELNGVVVEKSFNIQQNQNIYFGTFWETTT